MQFFELDQSFGSVKAVAGQSEVDASNESRRILAHELHFALATFGRIRWKPDLENWERINRFFRESIFFLFFQNTVPVIDVL